MNEKLTTTIIDDKTRIDEFTRLTREVHSLQQEKAQHGRSPIPTQVQPAKALQDLSKSANGKHRKIDEANSEDIDMEESSSQSDAGAKRTSDAIEDEKESARAGKRTKPSAP